MVKRVVKWTSNVLVILLLFICALTVYSIFQAKNNPEQIPTILGFNIMTVLTGSMEPVLTPGDLVITKALDPEKIQVDDVITYQSNQQTVITHRVVDVSADGGELLFETKGDANNIKDADPVHSDQLVGSLFISIPKAGYLVNFFKSPAGIAMLLVLPFLYVSKGMFNILFTNKKKQDEDLAV